MQPEYFDSLYMHHSIKSDRNSQVGGRELCCFCRLIYTVFYHIFIPCELFCLRNKELTDTML